MSRALTGSAAALGLAALVLASCGPTGEAADPLQLVVARAGPDTRLSLIAGPGVRINARLAPALELPNGSLLRFETGRITPDSAYFSEPPSTTVPGRRRTVHGTLRASICRADELVCRGVVMEI